ncbi:MAG: phage tail protein [Pseudomonadota bacterium]
MNANGADFLTLADPEAFATAEPGAFAWDATRGALRLATSDTPRLPAEPRAAALAAWAAARPVSRDGFGQIAILNDAATELRYTLTWPPENAAPVRVTAGVGTDTAAAILDPVSPPEGARFTDVHLGTGTRLALGYTDGASHGVLIVDLERRWQRRVALPIAPSRVWTDPSDRVWAASDTHLMLVRGRPLPQPYRPRPDRFEPVEIEPDPPRLLWQRLLPLGASLLGLAADDTHLYLLTWREEAAAPGHVQTVLRRRLDEDPAAETESFDLPPELPFATDLRGVEPGTLTLMVPLDPDDTAFRQRDLPAIRLETREDGGRAAVALPRRFPQPAPAAARFANGPDGRPWIVTAAGPTGLWPLAQVRYPAETTGTLAPLDSGAPGTVWHKIVLDACIPRGTTLTVEARARDDDGPLDRWHRQPAPVWTALPSELPFHAGIFAPNPGTEGTFEILLQRDDGAVRQIAGRRLELRLRLTSDGRVSPAIAAMRVYLPRRSWQELYLPRHFRQHGAQTDLPGPANGADMRERALAAFEGMLTPVEDRIAAAEAWLSPESAPSDHLSRLAGLVGGRAAEHWPEDRRRRWVAATGEMQRTRGTLAGLCLALDIATDGAVARGHVVPVETYRLRRAVATILGIDLDDRDHPLTLGTGENGNAIVGPNLLLSDETARDFLALFAPELAETTGDAAAVAAFFDRYAHRVSLVVHGPARPFLAQIEETAEAQIPAGVIWRTIETDRPFVMGLSPLLGIDTLLEESPAWRRVMLDDTFLGREGLLNSPAALAPELVSGAPISGDAT